MIMKSASTKTVSLLHIAALTLALLLLAWASISSLTFLVGDTGLRFIQVRELIAQRWQTFAIDYPAQVLDPDFQHTPFYYAYSIIEGDIYLNISHFFTFVASFLYAGLGIWGLAAAPALGGVLTAVAVYRLGVLTHVAYPRLLLWTAVFGTPILFYSLELWDHTWATACAAWAVYGLARGLMNGRWQPIFWGGVAAGIGLGQRPEMYVFAIALGGALVIVAWRQSQRWLALIGGGLAGALPVWFLQYRWVGHPFGLAFAPHFFGYGRPAVFPVQSYDGLTITPAVKIGRLLFYIQARDLGTFAAAMLIVLGLFILIFSLRVPAWRRPGWIWGSLILTVIGYGLFTCQAQNVILSGLFTTFPLIIFALAFVEKPNDLTTTRPVYLLAWLTAVIFIILMLGLWPAYGGKQWGARYLLPAYPLLLFAAFYSLTRRVKVEKRSYAQTLRAYFAVLLGVSLIMQILGARLIFNSHAYQLPVRDSVQALPADIILVNDPFFPPAMAATDKQFLYVGSAKDLQTLIPRLAESGVQRFGFITAEGSRLAPPEHIGNIKITQTSAIIYEIGSDSP